jgi:hypothetical protein
MVNAAEGFEGFKVEKTVDNFQPLTVNWLLGTLVNPLGNKTNAA